MRRISASVERLVVRDRFERLLRLGGIGVDHVRADTRLHRDDAHRVRDDVVQFLRDAQALVGDRPLGLFVALALESVGALLELLAVEPAVAHRRAEEVRGRVEHEVEHDVRAVGARDAADARRS